MQVTSDEKMTLFQVGFYTVTTCFDAFQRFHGNFYGQHDFDISPSQTTFYYLLEYFHVLKFGAQYYRLAICQSAQLLRDQKIEPINRENSRNQFRVQKTGNGKFVTHFLTACMRLRDARPSRHQSTI